MSLCPRDDGSNPDICPSGNTLTIEASGTFSKKVEKGAYVILTVKYGLITLVHTREDLCDQFKTIDKECPIGPGSVKITKDVEIPAQIPPVSLFSIRLVTSVTDFVMYQGHYTVTADVYTGEETKATTDKEDKQITCLTASISFAK